MKTDRSREISAKGSVLDANRLDGIALDKMDGITLIIWNIAPAMPCSFIEKIPIVTNPICATDE